MRSKPSKTAEGYKDTSEGGDRKADVTLATNKMGIKAVLKRTGIIILLIIITALALIVCAFTTDRLRAIIYITFQEYFNEF